jgi:hypothetical protein
MQSGSTRTRHRAPPHWPRLFIHQPLEDRAEPVDLRAASPAVGATTDSAESAIRNSAGQRSDHAQRLRLVCGRHARSAVLYPW